MDRRQPARRLTTQPKRSACDIIISNSSDEETKGDDAQPQQRPVVKAERATGARAKNNNILMLSPDAPTSSAKPAAKSAKAGANAGKAPVKKQATARTKSSQQQQELAAYPVLNVGDWIDVLDDVGVWNTAQVLSVPSEHSVKVRYNGWGDEYNEVVALDSDRIAPFHTYTWSVKCWVRYLNWPWWPAVTTIRVPGNKIGSANLQKLTKLHVNFLDQNNFTFWISKKDIVPFDHKFEQNCKKSTGQDFECSLNHVLQSSATNEFPKFAKGTLPKQFEFSEAAKVPETKRAIGDAQWFENFARNRELHFQMHGGKVVEHVPEKTDKNGKAASSKSSKNNREEKEEEEEDDEEDDEEPSPNAKKSRRSKVTKKSKVSAASPSRQLVLNQAATGKSKPSPVKPKLSVKGKTITTAAKQGGKSRNDPDEDDEQVADGDPHFHAAASKGQTAKDSKRKETSAKKVVVPIAKPTTTKLKVKALKETTPQVRKTAKSEALTPQKKISTAKQTKTAKAPTTISSKRQKQAEEPAVVPSSRKRARAGEKEAATATTTTKPRGGKRAEVLGEAVVQVKSEPIEHFAAEAEATYASSTSKVRKKLRTAAGSIHEADFDRYDDDASDESLAPAPHLRKKLKTKATESDTVKEKAEPKQPRAVKAANTILLLSKPTRGAKSVEKAENFHEEWSSSSKQISMEAETGEHAFVYSTPPPAIDGPELDHSNEFDALPLEKGTKATKLKTSEKKTGRTKMKVTAEANGKPTSGKKIQPVKNEECDEIAGLKIVKKWGVFSPQRFGGRVSMMRVGAHVTQSMLLDDEGDERPFVCVSAANKFGDHVQYPASHSAPGAARAKRASVRRSGPGLQELSPVQERTKHVRVWISFAQFEATFDKEAAREVFERALWYLKEQVSEDKKEERVLCLETWLAMEEKNGDAAMVKKIRDMLPRKVTEQRMAYAQDGTELGMEEYTDYTFPDGEQAQSHLKLLQAAQLWKLKKRAREEEEAASSSTETDKN